MAVQFIDSFVNLEFPRGEHLHCMVAQVPVRLRGPDHTLALEDPERQWSVVLSVLDRVAAGERLRKLHFLVFPESSVPAARFDDMLEQVRARANPNTVTIFGLEHVPLDVYREALDANRGDNGAALALVDHDLHGGVPPNLPVNWCCIAVKEGSGRVRAFLEAKTHPFHGEEFVNKVNDLYRGRHFYFLRSEPSCFNFMALICLDYLYRDVYSSNIRQIIDYANQLFFSTRQGLDALFVIQANPKPEHRAYWEVLSGFYGEYLEQTPGVRETVTVFANCSDESAIEGEDEGKFGVSSVVGGRQHRLMKVQEHEFRTDDFDGAPLCRLRFGTATRLFYFNLPEGHVLDPRSSRVPLKVHLIMHRVPGAWREELKVPWPSDPPPRSPVKP